MKVPSRLSPSCLLQVGLPSQELRHRLPERRCTSARCRVFQTGCYLSAWHSVSRPAEVRMPLTPKESVPEIMVSWYIVNMRILNGDNKWMLLPAGMLKTWNKKWSHTRTETSPSSFSISPSSAEMREDFPQPTWPTTASREPWGTITLILQTHSQPFYEESQGWQHRHMTVCGFSWHTCAEQPDLL